METIKIYNLSEMVGRRTGSRSMLKENEFSIYVQQTKDGKVGSHLLTFSRDAEFVRRNKMHMSIAENTLTSEIFFIFSNKESRSSVEIKMKPGSRRVRTEKNNVVRFLGKKLRIYNQKGMNVTLSFSENLSRDEDLLTYKILQNED